MKKMVTLLSACAFAVVANSQIYITDDWAGGTLTSNNNWITYTTDVTYNWVASDLGQTGDHYAAMTNYDTGNNSVTSWLITPVLDFTSAVDPTLSFDNAYNFAGDALELMVSTDYSGSGDPATATWTDHTSDATWSSGSFAWVGSGDIDLSTYNSQSTVYVAFKYTGTASDGSKWEIDDYLIQEGATVVTITPIYDIQYSLVGDSPELGNVVTTKGVVTGVYLFGSNVDRFFIQDSTGAWNGIYVYENGYTVAIGDSVLVTGEVLEFNSLTEIGFVTAVTILNSGNTLPAPVTVTSATIGNEEYEGVIVTLEDAICTTVTDGFGVWTANDGTAGDIDIDDDLLPTTFNSVLGDGYDVTGIRHYAFSENVFYPTSGASIVTVGSAGIDNVDVATSIYPNPANNQVMVNASPEAIVSIFSITGAVVANGVSNVSIDTADLEAGIYAVVVNENGVETTHKLVIQ